MIGAKKSDANMIGAKKSGVNMIFVKNSNANMICAKKSDAIQYDRCQKVGRQSGPNTKKNNNMPSLEKNIFI